MKSNNLINSTTYVHIIATASHKLRVRIKENLPKFSHATLKLLFFLQKSMLNSSLR